MDFITYECIFILLLLEWILYIVFILGYALYNKDLWMITNSAINVVICFIEFSFCIKEPNTLLGIIWFCVNLIFFMISASQNNKNILISSGLGFFLNILTICLIEYYVEQNNGSNDNLRNISNSEQLEENPMREPINEQ